MEPCDVLLLSPHFDDVALSCAGTLRRCARRGERTLVVTVFAGAPPAALPIRPLHRVLLGTPVIDSGDLVGYWRTRVAEDAAAMALLETAYVHLGLLDGAWRPEVATVDDLWLPPASRLVADVEAAVRACWAAAGEPAVYAPLAVGRHVDHAACFAAAESLRRAGARVAYYEDFPYAAGPGVLDARLAELAHLADRVVDISADLAARIAAVRCYRSQITGLFGGPERVAPAIEAFVAQRGGERLWSTAA